MPTQLDFLAQQQPNSTTIRALWYLQNFATQSAWTNGLAFEKQLRACRLDFTLSSLQRIDRLLDHIREQYQPQRETFFRQPENQTFLFLLAFYCGEMRGRLAKSAPVWYDWGEFHARYPELESIFPNILHYEFVAHFQREDGEFNHFPLVAILARLFDAAPDKSVYTSTLTGDYQAYGEHDRLPETAQHLAIDWQQALAQTPKNERAYLQILPPKWLQGDDLMTQMQALPQLYQRGRVVWAALVQANNLLFQANDTANCPAEIIYDKSGRTPPDVLRQWAKELFSLKNTTPSEPELARYAAHITDERTRFSGSIPKQISHSMPVFGASLLIWRLHLPNGILSLPTFPIVVADDCDEVMILPAKYWAHTAHYQNWIQHQSLEEESSKQPAHSIANNQEIFPVLQNILAREPDFWRGYDELLSPQISDLAQVGTQAVESSINNQTISEADRRFVESYRAKAQQEYRRWYEFFKVETDDAELAESLAKNELPESAYQKLRDLNIQPFLASLAEPIGVARLPKSVPLPKVAAAWQRDLSLTQTAKLVSFLCSQGVISLSKALANERKPNEPERPLSVNTTATLYLALLYLTGKGVPQTIEESLDWLNYAVSLGDYRAMRWVAELIIQVPELTPKLCRQELLQAYLPMSIGITNASVAGKLKYLVLELKAAEDAYPRERGAQLELARQKMQQAIAAGDVAAQTRLNEWLANGTLTEKAAEKRFEHIQYWISDYFAQKGVNLHAILQDIESPDDEDDVTFHENAAYSAHLADDDDVAKPAAWKKWAKWVLAMVLIYGIKTCALDYQSSRQQPENAVSGSLQTQSAPKITPTAEPADTATPKTAQAVGNQAVSAEDAVFILQQKLPLTLFTGYHEIRGARLEQGNIWLDLHDKNRGMMSIQAARGLYCREQAFDGIRTSGAPVNFAVTAAENVQYEIADLSCQ